MKRLITKLLSELYLIPILKQNFVRFKMAENKKKCLGKEISMDVKDTFFDDPFFRDWWNDFDVPMKDKTLQRQISGKT